MVAEIKRSSPQEIIAAAPNLPRVALDHRRSVSAVMEEMNPTEPNDNSGLDAFGRVLRAAKIIPWSLRGQGIYASEFEAFMKPGPDAPHRRALCHEWARRIWRSTQAGESASTRAEPLLLSSDFALGTVARPYAFTLPPRDQTIGPAIPVDELVAINTQIAGTAYKAVYVTIPAAGAKRMVRVGAGDEIPRVTISLSERIVNVYKYGRAIEMTYEAIRNQPIDRVALIIQQIAVQVAVDKLATIVDVLVNGDGNAASVGTTYNLTTLDAAAFAGTLTAKGWLAYKLKFKNPYILTHVLVQDAVSLQLQLLTMGNFNYPLANYPGALGSITPIARSLRDSVRLGETADAPSLKIVGIDARFALEHIVEEGSEIEETDRFINNQTQLMTLTSNEGYMVLHDQAIRILNVNA